jgi:cyclopropane fatty-acyl-phospholipid synthase-like methyltransferase
LTDFEAVYARPAPPWDIGRPQPAFAALAESGVLRGRILDVGCGTGALQLSKLGERFDTLLDCGLFHIFDDADRRTFVDNLREVTPVGGRYFMLCFSDRQPGTIGPRRITEAEIRTAFADGWHIDSIEPATIAINTPPNTVVQAWLASIQAVGG